MNDRPRLADGERWPEPEPRGWQGRTARGRRLLAIARLNLARAPQWRHHATDDDPWLNDTEQTGEGMTTRDIP